LDAVPSVIQEHHVYLGSPSGSFRVTLEPAATPIRELVSPATGMARRRVQFQLEGPSRVLLPPVQSDSIRLVEIDERRSRRSACNAILAEPALVPFGNGTILRRPPDTPTSSRPIDLPTGGSSPAGSEQLIPSSRVEVIRRSFEERGLSEGAIDLVLSSSRKNTTAAYQSAWNAWRDWCLPRNQDPLSASPAIVTNFLADFSVGRSYSSVNVARSMLSSTLSLDLGGSVGKDPLVVNLLRGLYNKSPPTPKYIATWNPDTVLNYFDAHANADLSLLDLSRKCVTLIALCSLLRTCEISSILLASISISGSRISFTLGRPRKAQHSGPLAQLSIDSWPDNVSICPVRCVELYITRTATVRTTRNSSTLFVSSTRPHGAVSPSTIGRWIKDQLGLAGIDTSSFKAHSTRGAAASKAVRDGLPIQTILDHGHWARESTFARFYHRDTVIGPFNPVGSSVLRVPR